MGVERTPLPHLPFPVPFSFFGNPLLLLLILGLASCRPPPPPLHLPPSFSFNDLASGQPFDTASLRGKLVLLNLWAAWSPASAKELPELVAIHEKFSPRGLVVLGICLDDAPSAGLLVFAERHGIHYPLLRPGPQTLDLLEPLETIPYTILLTPQGKILQRFRGPLKGADLRSAVEKNL